MSKKSLLSGLVLGAALALGGVEVKRQVDLNTFKYSEGSCITRADMEAPPAKITSIDKEAQTYSLMVLVAPGIAIPGTVSKEQLEKMELNRIDCETGEVLE